MRALNSAGLLKYVLQCSAPTVLSYFGTNLRPDVKSETLWYVSGFVCMAVGVCDGLDVSV